MRAALAAVALSAGCGAVLSSPAAAAVFPPDQPYMDNTAYAFGATDGLAASIVNEKAAVAYHQLTYRESGKRVDYTTTTGHLTATDANGKPEASMFYVAYTAKTEAQRRVPLHSSTTVDRDPRRSGCGWVRSRQAG